MYVGPSRFSAHARFCAHARRYILILPRTHSPTLHVATESGCTLPGYPAVTHCRGVARGGAPGARAPPSCSDQRAMAPYSAKIHDAYLCFYSETTLRSQSSRQKVEAMKLKWNASCAIAKR